MDTQTKVSNSLAVSFDELPQHVELYDIAKACVQDLNHELETLKPPVVPEWIDALEDYQHYEKVVNDYRIKRKRLQESIDRYYQEQLHEESVINTSLPLKNVWFKFLTSEGERWVGVETTDWGGLGYTLRIEKEKPAQPLKHQVSS